jgi:hypothetical protein
MISPGLAQTRGGCKWPRGRLDLDLSSILIKLDLTRLDPTQLRFELRGKGSRSNVEVLYLERVLLDELAPGLDIVAHQRGKQVIGPGDIFELNLEQGPLRGVHGRIPELVGVHLAEALEPGNLHSLLAEMADGRNQGAKV